MKLDHLNGRMVESISVDDENLSDWYITFDDGAIIRNTDARRTSAPDSSIIGMSLLNSSDDQTANTETLNFGYSNADGTTVVTSTLVLTRTQYQMARAGQNAQDPSQPHDSAQDLPDDPSPFRVVSGPQNGS